MTKRTSTIPGNPSQEETIAGMKFIDILHMENATSAIWKHDEAVAKALSAELNANVTRELAGRSSGCGSYMMVSFRIRDSRLETAGMENYLQLYTESGPKLTLRLFSYEEGHRERRIGGSFIPVVEKEYTGAQLDTFDVKSEYEKTFISPYAGQLSEWERNRLAALTKDLREFCNKRNIDGFSVTNFSRLASNA